MALIMVRRLGGWAAVQTAEVLLCCIAGYMYGSRDVEMYRNRDEHGEEGTRGGKQLGLAAGKGYKTLATMHLASVCCLRSACSGEMQRLSSDKNCSCSTCNYQRSTCKTCARR